MSSSDSQRTAQIEPRTLAVLAAAAGVSKSTVSRALNGNALVAVATREKIEAIAAKLGFRPNPYLKALTALTRESSPLLFKGTIAWVDTNPDPDPERWRQSYVQVEFFAGALRRAAELGYSLERFNACAPKLSADRLTDILLARGIQGALLANSPVYEGQNRPLPLRLRDLAVVQLGEREAISTLNFSVNNTHGTARRAHRKLRELGYRRVGFATTPDVEESVSYGFVGGYASVLGEAREPWPAPVHYHGDAVPEEDLGVWVRTHQLDAVLFTYWPEVETILRQASLRVPQDVALASAGWRVDAPHIAGMDQRHPAVAETAVNLLDHMLQHNLRGEQTLPHGHMIDSVWRDGATAPPKPVE